MKIAILTGLLCVCAVLPVSAVERREADVCVYGATSAGVIAAYTAKMDGKSVIMVDPGKHPGGMSSGGLGLTDIGNKYVVTGLARDFYRRVGAHYGKFEQWIFEPHVAEDIFNYYIDRAGLTVEYGYYIDKADTENGVIKSIDVVSVDGARDDLRIGAKMFIDCSYEGDLMAESGVSYTVGREGNSVYGETLNGVQMLDRHQFPDGVDPYKEPGNPASGLLWGISSEPIKPNGTGDKKVQAYNYRIALTNEPENMIPITRPAGYDSTRYELLLRLKEVSPWKSVGDVLYMSRMPGGKTDINNINGFSTDMIGMNWDYPEASYQERQEIIRRHEEYTKGLLYFLGHDSRVPDFIRDEMLRWGYPKDEYVDNGHWSPQLYVREARRMVGDLVMTQHHCQGRDTVSDPIGMAAYTMDSHNCDRHVVNGMVKNEGNVEVGGFPPYSISYRSIVPKRGEVKNLFVPVCLSASHIAYGSIRMEPVFMVLGQVAGLAASRAIDGSEAVQDVDSSVLMAYLEKNPLMDGTEPEILVDNLDSEYVEMTGNWEPYNDSYRAYGPDFKVGDVRKGKAFSMKFKPAVKDKGRYDIYMYVPKINDETTAMTVVVNDGEKSVDCNVAISNVTVVGQTLGEWVSLGQFELSPGCYVEISEKGADKIVAADAVLFKPVD